MSLNLTPAELHDLTDYEVAAWQIKWLKARGWKYEVGASGRPKVSRAYYEQMMGVTSQRDQEPDFSILEKAA